MQKSMNLDGFAPVKVGRSARTKWTPEMVDELRRLRAQGLTATQIADRMGLDAEKIEKKCYSLGIKRGAAAVTGGSNTPAQDEDCRVADAPRNDNEETAGGESSDSSREPDTEKRKEQHDLEHMTIGKLVALCGEDRETEIFVNGQPVRIVQYMERYDLEARCGAALVDLISADKNRQP